MLAASTRRPSWRLPAYCVLAIGIGGCAKASAPASTTPAASNPEPAQLEATGGVEVLGMDALAVQDRGLFQSVATLEFSPPGTPGHLKLGPLRLFGFDTVRPGGVFELHEHKDVEVITMALEGALVHGDDAGNAGQRIEAGGVQVMRAGSGLQHTEANASPDEPFVGAQIWVAPRTEGNEPSVAHHHFDLGPEWTLMVAPEGAPLSVDQDLRFAQVRLPPSGSADWEVAPGRAAYVAVADGAIEIAGQAVGRFERAIVRQSGRVTLSSEAGAHVLLMDLPVGG